MRLVITMRATSMERGKRVTKETKYNHANMERHMSNGEPCNTGYEKGPFARSSPCRGRNKVGHRLNIDMDRGGEWTRTPLSKNKMGELELTIGKVVRGA